MGYEIDTDPTPGFQTLDAFKTYPDGSVLRMYLMPSDKEVDQRRGMPDDNRGLSDYSTLDASFTYYPIQVTKKFFGLYKSKERMMQDLSDEAGRNIDLGIGMFDIPVEDSVNKIVGLLQKAEHASKTEQTDQTNQTSHNIDGKYNPDVTSSYMNMIDRNKNINYNFTNETWKPIIGSINKEIITKDDLVLQVEKPNFDKIRDTYIQQMLEREKEREEVERLVQEYENNNNLNKEVQETINKPIEVNAEQLSSIENTFTELKKNSLNDDNIKKSMSDLDLLMKSINDL
jgi:hypothetical protein